MKSQGLNLGTAFDCKARSERGWNSSVAVKCVDMGGTPMAKAAPGDTDAEARKRGEQTGLDTLVVHAVNDVNWLLGVTF